MVDNVAPRLSVVMPILINHDWQIPMTRCAIETLATCADKAFQLIIVEAGRNRFDPECYDLEYISALERIAAYTYIHRSYDPGNKNPSADINAGIDKATADISVYTGNDVFVRDGWDTALLECFKVQGCGMATLASADLRAAPCAQLFGQRIISEGLYGPFCAFYSWDRFDAVNFPTCWADSDMIMRTYKRGLRMYRNNLVVIEHLNGQTINGESHVNDFNAAKERFYERHLDANIFTFRALMEGFVL